MTDSPHYPPVHRKVTASRFLVSLGVLVLAAIAAFAIWDRWVPSERYLFAEATEKLRTEYDVTGEVTCRMIEPARAEEREGADAWFICQHSGTAEGEVHLFFWHDRIEGRRGVFGGRQMMIEGNSLWKL